MTCRDEILQTVQQIISQKGKNEFTPIEVVEKMVNNETIYSVNTIRVEITNRMCAGAPKNHYVKYDDFARIGKGMYKLL